MQASTMPTESYKAADTQWKMIKHDELDALPNQ